MPKTGTRPIKGTKRMIENMTPVLQPGTFVFCSMIDNAASQKVRANAAGFFVEDEGVSLILRRSEADRLGLSYDGPMKQITLMVFSSLTGVGLTAAVTKSLAREKIPANVVAAVHHDHVFVPEDQADKAMEILRNLQDRARATRKLM
jgi:hypothetical protein